MYTITVLLSLAAAPPVCRLDRHGDALPTGAVSRLGSARLRHVFTMVNAAAISADGSRVATAAGDVRVWDTATGRQLAHFIPPDLYTWAVAFTPEATGVFTAHSSEVRLWDVRAGTFKPRWGGLKPGGFPKHFAFTRDGRTLAIFCEGGGCGDQPTTIHVFDFPSGKERRVITPDFTHISEGMAFTRDGRLAVPSLGLRLLDVGSGKEVARHARDVGVRAFALAPDGKTAAILTPDKTLAKKGSLALRLVRLDTGAVSKTDITAPDSSILSFSPDGKELVIAPYKGAVTAIDPATGVWGRLAPSSKGKARELVPDDRIWRPWAAFSADSRWLARTDGQSVRVNDTRTGKASVTFEDHRDGSETQPVASGGLGIDVAISPDGRHAATRSGSEVRIWELFTGRMLRRIGGTKLYPGMRWTPDGKQVAFGRPGVFAWHDARTGEKAREVPLPATKQDVSQARLQPGGERILFREQPRYLKGPITLLAAADGKKVTRHEGKDGLELADVSDDARRVLWLERPDEGIILRVEEGGKRVLARAYTDIHSEARLLAGGRLLAVTGLRDIEIVDVARGRPSGPKATPGKRGYRTSLLAASPDGRLLAVADGDVPPEGITKGWTSAPTGRSALRVIETATGRVRATVPILPTISGAVFTPDGRHLVTTSADATALVWNVDEMAPPLLGDAWEALAGDGPAANAAIADLKRRPAEAVAMLRKMLPPARVDAGRVRALIAGLDAEGFDERQDAERRLAALSSDVEADLVAALKGAGTEAAARLGRLVPRAEGGTPEAWRHSRAVEVLERIATPDAVRLLRGLAAGYAGARRTREAKEALGRLATR